MFSHPWFSHSNGLKTINVRNDFKRSEQAPDMNLLPADNWIGFIMNTTSRPREGTASMHCVQMANP